MATYNPVNVNQTNQATKNIPEIKHLNITLDESALEKGALEIISEIRPKWQSVKLKVFTEGITNKLVGCYEDGKFDNEVILVRVFGQKTELIIDRDQEKKNIVFLSKNGCSAPLHAVFSNGIAYGFVYGKTLDEKTVRDDNIKRLIAKEISHFHTLDSTTDGHESGLYPRLYKFLQEYPKSFEDTDMQKRFLAEVKPKSELMAEFKLLKEHTEALQCPVVFSHNDLHLKNIIYNEKMESVSFIDLEYAMNNYQPFDVANHFCEYADVVDFKLYPEREYQLSWIRTYLENVNERIESSDNVTDIDVERFYIQVNKFALVAHFLWGIWALIQAKHSTIDFDFLGYGISKLNEYFAKKDKFLALTMPQ